MPPNGAARAVVWPTRTSSRLRPRTRARGRGDRALCDPPTGSLEGASDHRRFAGERTALVEPALEPSWLYARSSPMAERVEPGTRTKLALATCSAFGSESSGSQVGKIRRPLRGIVLRSRKPGRPESGRGIVFIGFTIEESDEVRGTHLAQNATGGASLGACRVRQVHVSRAASGPVESSAFARRGRRGRHDDTLPALRGCREGRAERAWPERNC